MTITVDLTSAEFDKLLEKCIKIESTIEEIVENFIRDLVNNDSNESEERRNHIKQWYYMLPKPSLLDHLLYWGFDPEEYLNLLDEIETAEKDKEYFKIHPEEAGEEAQYIDSDIEECDENRRRMEVGWWSWKKEANREEETAALKEWVKKRKEIIDD